MRLAIRILLSGVLFSFCAVHAQDVEKQLKQQLQDYLQKTPSPQEPQPSSGTPALENLKDLFGGSSRKRKSPSDGRSPATFSERRRW